MRVREQFAFLPSLDVCTCAAVTVLALGDCAVCGLRVVVDHFHDNGTPMALELTVSAPSPPGATYVVGEVRPVGTKGGTVWAQQPPDP
jgi:hypothetical protein